MIMLFRWFSSRTLIKGAAIAAMRFIRITTAASDRLLALSLEAICDDFDACHRAISCSAASIGAQSGSCAGCKFRAVFSNEMCSALTTISEGASTRWRVAITWSLVCADVGETSAIKTAVTPKIKLTVTNPPLGFRMNLLDFCCRNFLSAKKPFAQYRMGLLYRGGSRVVFKDNNSLGYRRSCVDNRNGIAIYSWALGMNRFILDKYEQKKAGV
jgi:hypothetical protein